MITVIEGTNGYTIAANGQLLKVTNEHGHHVPAQFTADDIGALLTALNATLTPLSTGAVTPAKAMARMKPPIKRYADGTVASIQAGAAT